MPTTANVKTDGYVGRFAPSPTGLLHSGSLVAALASYLDARAHGGRWLIRLEDVDQDRTVPGSAESIVQTLAAFGMQSDGVILSQSHRDQAYTAAFRALGNDVYPCGCSRREIADSIALLPTQMTIVPPYPGTCRHGLPAGKAPRAWRVRVPETGQPDASIQFEDRACGTITQQLSSDVGDFVLRRADGFWAYQLAVVVDDAAQGITHVVRGLDLLESTPRQIFLQKKLGVPTPSYLHVPLMLNAHGRKLSKQDGARPLESAAIVKQLTSAACILGLDITPVDTLAMFWREAIPKWAARYLKTSCDRP